jgi:hypothetical protein
MKWGRSTPFKAWARRSAHLVQFGSFVFMQPQVEAIPAVAVFYVRYVHCHNVPTQTAQSSFIRPREAAIVWGSVTGRLWRNA